MASKITVESWRPLYEFTSHEVSNFGRLRSINRQISVYRGGTFYYAQRTGKIIGLRHTYKEPYLFTVIHGVDGEGNTIKRTIYIHRAVADHFIKKTKKIKDYEDCGGKIHATHLVKDYNNNRSDNLKFITHSELIHSQSGAKERGYRAWITRRHRYGQTGFKDK